MRELLLRLCDCNLIATLQINEFELEDFKNQLDKSIKDLDKGLRRITEYSPSIQSAIDIRKIQLELS